ncbi:hypothetical protein [Dialister invisus]|uniref:hypothetical protein n=1 Tax=Dialister invisus TaxID=218538 RepID=UPI0028D1F86A|nr:hypothetical protein [Dialister invisus]
MGKTGNGTVAQSEESIALMTPYRLPHHRHRFFAGALNDALPMSSLEVQILHVRL